MPKRPEGIAHAPSGGPLYGLRVLEFAALGPAPFACMLLSDMGADVVTVERPGTDLRARDRILNRGRTVVLADLKDKTAREELFALSDQADVLIESFRPGVMERLGLGPDVLHARNPRLIYGRLTGYGQDGGLAHVAGHDINFLAVTGALHAIGSANGPPAVPMNILGDYAAGSLYLVSGVLAALHEREKSGHGQVVDASITDGLFSLMSTYLSHFQQGRQSLVRGQSLLDGGSPFYGVYETADGKYVSVGAIEPRFFENLCDLLEIAPEWKGAQYDKSRWPALRKQMAEIFIKRSRQEWAEHFQGTDACCAPVLNLREAMDLQHHKERESFIEVDAMMQPAPAPRFSRTSSSVQFAMAQGPTGIPEVSEIWKR